MEQYAKRGIREGKYMIRELKDCAKIVSENRHKNTYLTTWRAASFRRQSPSFNLFLAVKITSLKQLVFRILVAICPSLPNVYFPELFQF